MAEQEENTGEESSRELGIAGEVENIEGAGAPSEWERLVPLGSLEMGEGSWEVQAQGQCS